MKNMTLEAIAKACNGKLFCSYNLTNQEVQGVVLDSRKIDKDYLFIATVGERVDGHDFIEEAYAKGAMAVICEKPPINPAIPYILVDSSFEALKAIATWYRSQLDIKVIGVTGSVGKTSTKEFISSVLSQRYRVLKTEGNFNNEVGLPLTILRIRDDHEIAVLEMGISEYGEMHRLSAIAKPDLCVITNIGPCHLENLGSLEGVLKAKSEIFDYMKENGSVCINGDDKMLSTIKDVKGIKPLIFGLNNSYDVYASDITYEGLYGSSCNIHVNGQIISTSIPLPGEHMVYNALAATALGNLFKMTADEISSGIMAVKPVNGRSNIITMERWTIIDDCYNANPISMKAAIKLLKKADENKIAILGDMFELGENEAKLHKEVGSYAGSLDLDVLICVGKLSSHMYDGAMEAGFKGNLLYFETRDELLDILPSFKWYKSQKSPSHSPTILVKASHGMGFDKIVKVLKE